MFKEVIRSLRKVISWSGSFEQKRFSRLFSNVLRQGSFIWVLSGVCGPLMCTLCTLVRPFWCFNMICIYLSKKKRLREVRFEDLAASF